MIFFFVGLAFILGAGIVALSLPARPALRARLYQELFAVGCAFVLIAALQVLLGSSVPDVRFETGVPGGAWVFGIDALSALFLLIIIAVGVPAAFYGLSYFRTQQQQARVRVAHLLLALVVVSLLLVVVARAAIPFLIAWESMAVIAYLLIVFEHEKVMIRRAGMLYLVATHTATLALFILFAVWGNGAPDLTFAALAAWQPTTAGARTAILALALLGFGLKAGLVPLHFWLPEAHAAAPSHVSALMSGVVIKMGIYGLLRVVALWGLPPAWWGWLLLGAGVLSGVLGVLWALGQHDLKRLLAFHSVENIGIILLGLGTGVLGYAYHNPLVSLLGFTGAALHTLNHALFKSLLFLGAGSVYHRTGTRDLEQLGGLYKWMPQTAIAFMIGSAAIVGLPPLNGFVSEWLVFRSLLHAGTADSSLRLAILAAASLGLIGALALACFAKVVGVVFLGVPRQNVSLAHEHNPGMLWPQYALAGACIAIGLLPVVFLPLVLRVAAVVTRFPLDTHLIDSAARSLTAFALAVFGALVLAWTVRHQLARRVLHGTAETWGCGYDAPTPRMQYTGSSFAAPILAAYEPVAGIERKSTANTLSTHAIDPVLDRLLLPVWWRVRLLAQRARPIQRGRLSLYLVYVVLALVALLLYMMVAGRPV